MLSIYQLPNPNGTQVPREEAEISWFEGFYWSVLVCDHCSSGGGGVVAQPPIQIGWRFRSIDRSKPEIDFFALIVAEQGEGEGGRGSLPAAGDGPSGLPEKGVLGKPWRAHPSRRLRGMKTDDGALPSALRTTGEMAVAASEWENEGIVLHSLGNHRVRLRCPSNAPAVIATVEWRRADDVPMSHGVYLTRGAASTEALALRNVSVLNISRVSGTVIFDTRGGGTEFFMYWLPFTKNHLGQWGAVAVSYDPPKQTAAVAWMRAHVVGARERASLCTVVAYEARDDFNKFTAMEVVASAAEMAKAAAAAGSAPFIVFPEDRANPVREFERLPAAFLPLAAAAAATGCRVAATAPPAPQHCHSAPSYRGMARPGEFFTFQIVVWALQPLSSLQLTLEPLQPSSDPLIRYRCIASDFTSTECSKPSIALANLRSINTGGVSYLGVPFTKQLNVTAGNLQPLWVGVDVPINCSDGVFFGSFTVHSVGTAPVAVDIQLAVGGEPMADHGDADPSKFSRLRWLDSTVAMDDEPTRGFGPLSLDNEGGRHRMARVGAAAGHWIQQVSGNGKLYNIEAITGLPAGIAVLRANDGVALPVLGSPISLQVVDSAGSDVDSDLSWCSFTPGGVPSGFHWTKQASARLAWTARAISCTSNSSANAPSLHLEVNGTLSFDGYFDYKVRVTCAPSSRSANPQASNDGCAIRKIALRLNFSASASKFAMGLGARGMQWPPKPPGTAPHQPALCLPRTPGNQLGNTTRVGSKVQYSYWNAIQDLCSKSTGSVTLYSGLVCDSAGGIHWDRFVTLQRRKGLENATCAWNCSNGPGTEYCGVCGHHASGTPLVPSRLCNGPATPPPPPAAAGLEWRWAEAVNATLHGKAAKMAWIGWVGSIQHGLRLKLKGQEDVWDGPLNPMSVCDEGTHVCVGPGGSSVHAPDGWAHGQGAGLTLSNDSVLSAHSGAREMAVGDSVDMRFDLVTTPAKPIDPGHWHWRYLMGCGGCEVYGAAFNQQTGKIPPPQCLNSASNFGEKVENATLMGFNAGE